MMFFDKAFSEAGRSSSQQLDQLRIQLGVGCDPAHDYSAQLEAQKQLVEKTNKKGHKDKDKDKQEGSKGPGDVSGPASGLEQLRRALRDVIGSGGDALDELHPEEAAGASPGGVAYDPNAANAIKKQREATRQTSAFKAITRTERDARAIENHFRAPPVGTYKPKEHLLQQRKRLQGSNFAHDPSTRSRKVIAVQEECDRLKEEGLPFDHLVKSGTSIELLEHIPERLQKKQRNFDIAKVPPRPDLVKSANIKFNDNSFTAGVLEGDQIYRQRNPHWDFAKTSTAEPKVGEYYWQPGQYQIKLDAVRQKMAGASSFDHGSDRKPMNAGCERAGDHLPDRSLSRSLPVLSTTGPAPKSLNFNQYTVRPPMINPKNEYHDVDNPATDAKVMQGRYEFDAFVAAKATWRNTRQPDHFHKHLDRFDALKVQRQYGDDISCQLAKDNKIRGPVSVELLDNHDVHNKPQLQPKILTGRHFDHMPGREKSGKYMKAPARQKSEKNDKAALFLRGTREGDSRCEANVLSDTAATIKQLRNTRTYVQE